VQWLRFDEWEFGSPGREALEVVVSSPRQHPDFPTFVAQTLLAGDPAGAAQVAAVPPRTGEELLLGEWAVGVVEHRCPGVNLAEASLCGLYVAAANPDRREVALDSGDWFAAVRWERRAGPAEPSAAAGRGRR
jgi:hypothetical protein